MEEKKKGITSHMGFQDDGHIDYDLRENPEKSWKFSGFQQNDTAPMQESENRCKVCGKEFESLKALYGHMRHHSGRERRRIPCKECSKEFLSSKSLANHMRVHSQKLRVRNESGISSSHDVAVKRLVVKRKRSDRKRYNFTASSSISGLNESLPVTEIDQVEQAAVCLMMLSRGGQNWGEFYAVGEFSDNDSVTFEVKALTQKKGFVTNESGYFVANGNGTFKMKKPREQKLDACDSESLIVSYEKEGDESIEMDFRAASNEEKKAKWKVSIERFYNGSEFKILKLDERTGSESNDSEIQKEGDVKFKSNQIESNKDLMEQDGLDETALGILTSASTKIVNFHASDTEFGENLSTKVTSSDCKILDDSQKTTFQIKCKTCDKVFCSRRALGGHQRKHSTRKHFLPPTNKNSEKQHQPTIFPEIEDGCKLVKREFVENLMEHEIVGTAAKFYESRESKKHKCHICLKVFATGQALGGHKRAHIGKNFETKECSSDVCDELDLNVPVMLIKEPNADVGSKPWWVGREQKHEPLVSLVAN